MITLPSKIQLNEKIVIAYRAKGERTEIELKIGEKLVRVVANIQVVKFKELMDFVK